MNIVIVGGGTAGWLTALFISKVKPEHTVTVIESSSVGIIGVGESSTGALLDVINNVIWNFDCNLPEFLQETGATLKYGIKHQNWTTRKQSSYLAPIDGSPTGYGIPDNVFSHSLDTLGDNLHRSTLFGQLMEHNISPISRETNKFTLDTHALHFNTFLVGNYFKKICNKTNRVTVIDANIARVNLKENGFIKSVLLDNATEVAGDLFIDATGFKRVLMNELDNSWISYKKHLPVNAALPFFLKYKENETPYSWTMAWAQDHGWMWQIPLQERQGCGYVFSDETTTFEKAHQELETLLGQEIEPIKQIKFDSGRLENVWVKNCVAIGLSSAFTEPLEATSVHSIIVQLLHLVFEFLRPTVEDTCNPGSIKNYNRRVGKMYDDFKDFLVCHYLGGRTDTEFWRHITAGNTKTDFTEMIVEMCRSKMPSINDFDQYPGAAGWHLWQYVLAGIGKLNPGVCNLNEFLTNDAIQKLNQTRHQIEEMKHTHYPYSDFNSLVKK